MNGINVKIKEPLLLLSESGSIEPTKNKYVPIAQVQKDIEVVVNEKPNEIYKVIKITSIKI